jgi:hypothetical protein
MRELELNRAPVICAPSEKTWEQHRMTVMYLRACRLESEHGHRTPFMDAGIPASINASLRVSAGSMPHPWMLISSMPHLWMLICTMEWLNLTCTRAQEVSCPIGYIREEQPKLGTPQQPQPLAGSYQGKATIWPTYGTGLWPCRARHCKTCWRPTGWLHNSCGSLALPPCRSSPHGA